MLLIAAIPARRSTPPPAPPPPPPIAWQGDQHEVLVVQGQWLERDVSRAPKAAWLELYAPGGVDRSFRGWLSNAALNMRYAQQHGYAYQMYGYTGPSKVTHACSHPTRGPTFSNWCKVLAMLHALDHYPRHLYYFWLDSDAVVRSFHMSFKHFLATTRLTNQTHTRENCGMPTSRRALDEPRPVIMLWHNTPYGCAGTTGNFIVRRSRVGLQAMRDWWGWSGEAVGSSDQGSFNLHIATGEHRDAIHVLADDSTHIVSGQSHLQYVLHRCSGCGWLPSQHDVWSETARLNRVTNASMLATMAQVVAEIITI